MGLDHEKTIELRRIADALERITHLLEQQLNTAGLTRTERIMKIQQEAAAIEATRKNSAIKPL